MMASALQTLLQPILAYYADVDASTYKEGYRFKTRAEPLARVVDLFDENGVYERQASPIFVGKAAIQQFFAEGRSLYGHHAIHRMDMKDGVVSEFAERLLRNEGLSQYHTLTVRGTFKGSLCSKAPADEGIEGRRIRSEEIAHLDFIDHWVMNEKGKIVFRQSDISPHRRIAPPGMQGLGASPY